jgi:peptidoglycan/LPS O-acetylase OafA/YrhL
MLALAYMLATWTIESLAWLRVANGLDLMTAPVGSFDAATERVADVIRYFPPLRIGEFALGEALCALWRKGRLPSDPRQLLGTAAGGAAAIVLLAEQLPGPALFNGASVIAWAPLVVWGANAHGGWLGRPIFVLLGRISFALYLTHASVGYYAHAVDKYLLGGRLAEHPAAALILVSLVSCLVAYAVFHLVEEPMRRRIVARWEGRMRRATPASMRPQPVAVGDLRPAE